MNYPRVLFPILTGGVIVILSLLLFRSCDQVKELKDEQFNDRRKAENVELIEKAKDAAISDTVELLKSKLRIVTQERDSLIGALKSKRTLQVTRVEKLRPEIQALADSVPVLKEFISGQDSIIEIQDRIIATNEASFQAQVSTFEEIISLKDQQIESAKAVGDAWREAAESEGKKARKEERKSKRNRTIAIVLGGIAGVLAVIQAGQ